MIDINNLLKDTFFVRNILTKYLLRHDRSINVLLNPAKDEISIIISMPNLEIMNLRLNYLHEYKKTRLPYKILHLTYVKESPVHKNGKPLSFEEWIENKITEMELSAEDQAAFDAWMIGQKNHD